ncbi:MAG: glycosyltransferase family 9 protein [Candidatus Omnitrophica bacterium]|nr:glycosyltransferase family 9 protein [Candidatus Omnitrophota bacterium]MDD5672245.1 glycosyltransferase family 9 protein [Candidatus Omnitrophota bacterium]
MQISLPSDRPLRILVTRTDRIGDLVLSTPVFSALREKFRKAWIACLTFCENREIVEGNPCLDEIILYDKKGSEKDFWGNFIFARRLAGKHFDVVIHLHTTNRMHWSGWLAGIPVRIGYARKCAWALTDAIPDRKKEGTRHEAQYNFDLLKPLGITEPEHFAMYFPLKEKARESLQELLRHHGVSMQAPWVVLNPSASCPSKIWSPERFGHLADKIAGKYKIAFIAIGARKDRALVERMRKAAKVPICDFSGKLSLGMLGVLLSSAALVISNDSGPVHIANAVGVPVISIFGRKQPGLSPTRWGPLGKDSRFVWKDVGCVTCLAHQCRLNFLCLDAISVEDVFTEVERFESRLHGAVMVS